MRLPRIATMRPTDRVLATHGVGATGGSQNAQSSGVTPQIGGIPICIAGICGTTYQSSGVTPQIGGIPICVAGICGTIQ
jgi:hypothetical protein